MRSLWVPRLRTRYLLLGALPAAVLMLLIGGYATSAQLENVERFFALRGQALARELAANSLYGLFSDNRPVLRALVEKHWREPDVVAVTLRGRDGAVLLTFPEAEPAAVLERARSFREPVRLSGLDIGDPRPDDARPPGLGNPSMLGEVELWMSTAWLERRQRQIVATMGLLGGLGLLLTGLIAWRLGRGVARPLELLAAAMQRVQSGEHFVRTPVNSTGELGELQTGFNRMAEGLGHNQEELQTQVEQATAELMETLETLEIKNVQLDLARKRAVRAMQVKTDFLANMSHEIRTPINGIIGFLNLLQKTPLNPIQSEYVKTIGASAAGLLDIINDVLDLSQLESGKFSVQPGTFRLRPLLDDTVALLAPQAHTKGLELVLLVYRDVPDRLIGDAGRVRQVVTNLVSNAIKFTNRGEVVIRVMLDDDGTGGDAGGEGDITSLGFVVSDTGVGIAEADRALLFTGFGRAASTVRHQVPGTGLGLAITQRLVKALGGVIRYESRLGQGSRFSVILPLKRGGDSRPSPVTSTLSNRHVWLCDPHRLAGLALRHRFESWGMRVAEVNGYADLAALLSTGGTPDIVVIGVSKADLARGVSFASLASSCRSSGIPLVVLASCSCERELQPISDLGASVLSKPATGRALQQVLLRSIQGVEGISTASVKADRSEEQWLAGRRFLVVDDHEVNRRFMYALLRQAGAEVELAEDGAAGVATASRSEPDLVFMDLLMPGVDGFEATEMLRSSSIQRISKVPIVGLTADVTPAARERALLAGMNQCLIKPVSEADLQLVLETELNVHAPRSSTDIPLGLPEEAGDDLSVRDARAAIRVAGGNPQLAAETWLAFRQQLPGELEGLSSAFGNRDWAALADLAHRMNGAASYCCLPALQNALAALDAAARESLDEARLGQNFRLVQSEIARVLSHGADAGMSRRAAAG